MRVILMLVAFALAGSAQAQSTFGSDIPNYGQGNSRAPAPVYSPPPYNPQPAQPGGGYYAPPSAPSQPWATTPRR